MPLPSVLSAVRSPSTSRARREPGHLGRGEQVVLGELLGRLRRARGSRRPRLRPRVAAERRADAAASVTREPLTSSGGDRASDADRGVRTPPRGPGAADDRRRAASGRPRPLAQRLEQRRGCRWWRRRGGGRTARWRSAARARRSARGRPISRAMSAMLTLASWVSSSALRWVTGQLAEGVEGGLASGSRPLSRCQIRAVCRRCACAHACGRTQALGVVAAGRPCASGARRRRTCRARRCARPGGHRSARRSAAAVGSRAPCRTRRSRRVPHGRSTVRERGAEVARRRGSARRGHTGLG